MDLRDGGVSSAIGTILLIAMVLVIAGGVGYVFLGKGTPEPAPSASLSAEAAGEYIYINHDGADTIADATKDLLVKLNGKDIDPENLTVGGSKNNLKVGGSMEISVDFSKGDKLKVIHKPSNSILLESTIEKNPPKPSPTVSIIDTFEDGNIAEYSGDTDNFAADNTWVHDGSYGLEVTDKEGENQIYRDGYSISQGDTITFWQYVDIWSSDEPTFQWGTSYENNYAVALDTYDGVISIAKDVTTNDGRGTILNKKSPTFNTQWYKVRIDWKTSDNIAVTVFENDGSTVFEKISVVDDTYESADTIGFGYWWQHGGWDTVKVSG